MIGLFEPSPDDLARLLIAVVHPEDWARNASRRRAWLAEVFVELVERTGIPELTLYVGRNADMALKRGMYDHERRAIWVHERRVDDSNAGAALGTLVHEYRHAVQMHVIDGKRDESQDDLETLARWAQSSASVWYDKIDPVWYRHSALEIDANLVQHATLAAYWRRAC